MPGYWIDSRMTYSLPEHPVVLFGGKYWCICSRYSTQEIVLYSSTDGRNWSVASGMSYVFPGWETLGIYRMFYTGNSFLFDIGLRPEDTDGRSEMIRIYEVTLPSGTWALRAEYPARTESGLIFYVKEPYLSDVQVVPLPDGRYRFLYHGLSVGSAWARMAYVDLGPGGVSGWNYLPEWNYEPYPPGYPRFAVVTHDGSGTAYIVESYESLMGPGDTRRLRWAILYPDGSYTPLPLPYIELPPGGTPYAMTSRIFGGRWHILCGRLLSVDGGEETVLQDIYSDGLPPSSWNIVTLFRPGAAELPYPDPAGGEGSTVVGRFFRRSGQYRVHCTMVNPDMSEVVRVAYRSWNGSSWDTGGPPMTLYSPVSDPPIGYSGTWMDPVRVYVTDDFVPEENGYGLLGYAEEAPFFVMPPVGSPPPPAPPFGSRRVVLYRPNYFDGCLDTYHRLCRDSVTAHVCQNYDAVEEWLREVRMPSRALPFRERRAIPTPLSSDGDVEVLRFRVPEGFDAVVRGIYHHYTGPGFVQGSGDIEWRLRVGRVYPRFMGRMTVEMGDVDAHFPISGLLVPSGQTVYYIVNVPNLSGGILPENSEIVCSIEGWLIPRR